jgi:hypothetical protein
MCCEFVARLGDGGSENRSNVRERSSFGGLETMSTQVIETMVFHGKQRLFYLGKPWFIGENVGGNSWRVGLSIE